MAATDTGESDKRLEAFAASALYTGRKNNPFFRSSMILAPPFGSFIQLSSLEK